MKLYVENELQHAGVKGMKWGHRKAKEQTHTDKKQPKNKKPSSKKTRKYVNVGKIAVNTAIATLGVRTVMDPIAMKLSELGLYKAAGQMLTISKVTAASVATLGTAAAVTGVVNNVKKAKGR